MSLLGRVLGKYRLVERLGSGALADVYRGLQLGLERTVVVKVLPAALASDATVRARFKRAGLTTARLSHPNIITVFDCNEDAGIPYTVMEALRPESLEDRIVSTGPLAWPTALKLATDVTRALVYAHGRGVCHGGLEASSVKFDQRSNAILTDFAGALDVELATSARDLTALGGVLHAALTGALETHSGKAAPYPDTTPVELAALVETLMAGGCTDARALFEKLKEIELRLRARQISRALPAPPPPVPAAPSEPVFCSSDSLSFLSSISRVMSDGDERRDVFRAFSWATPVFLLTLCGALLVFH